MTRVVHCKREPYDVYIGRPSKWGNPIKLARGADMIARLVCLRDYCQYLLDGPDQAIQLAITELAGRTLGCWCAPRPCHGHVLAAIAESTDVEQARARLRLEIAGYEYAVVLWKEANGEP